MSDPFIAEIRLFTYNFAPKNWAYCAGQIMPISQNTALFSLLGTNYGGNGTTNFALPNLIGNVAVGAGSGPGLTPRDLGETGGSATVTINQQSYPSHTHNFQGFDNALAKATDTQPANNTVFARTADYNIYNTTVNQNVVQMAPQVVGTSNGGGQPHNNAQPYITISACIALQGIFPPRP